MIWTWPPYLLICVAKVPSEATGTVLAPGFIPGEHLLRAAQRVFTCLEAAPQSLMDFRVRLKHLPTDGLFTAAQLLQGEEILVRSGLAFRTIGDIRLLAEDDLGTTELMARFLEVNPPPWLGVVTRDGEVDPTLIPMDDASALAGVFGDPDRRDDFLLSLGNKFAEGFLAGLGLEAELVVVEACRSALIDHGRPDLAVAVLHASKVSDQLGYDIRTPTLAGGVLRLEVKRDGSSGPGRRFLLSRNEWQVATRDPDWRLVLCVTEDGGKPRIEGWLGGSALAGSMPLDSERAKWQSAEVRLPDVAFNPGLPNLSGA